tara:strand:+ start:4691 stop:5071 length:381 start_codon:yes stop_codon:yes gene_type:complete
MIRKLINFDFIEKAKINVYENFPKDFQLKRVFIVNGKNGEVRGDHAHKKCTQILICISGEVIVDINKKEKVVLSIPSEGLIIPPLIWSSQRYVTDKSMLMVLCDYKYDEKDYIRNYLEYLKIIDKK